MKTSSDVYTTVSKRLSAIVNVDKRLLFISAATRTKKCLKKITLKKRRVEDQRDVTADKEDYQDDIYSPCKHFN